MLYEDTLGSYSFLKYLRTLKCDFTKFKSYRRYICQKTAMKTSKVIRNPTTITVNRQSSFINVPTDKKK